MICWVRNRPKRMIRGGEDNSPVLSLVGESGTDQRFRNRKTRPCVIISPDELAALKTVIVAPMTTQGFDFPSRISCEFAEKQALILLDQMRAVDKDRLLEKMGILEASVQRVIGCLLEMFAE